MKLLTFALVFISLIESSFSMNLYPRKDLMSNIERVTSELKSKNYIIENYSRIQIKLKENDAVRYFITTPFYGSPVGIGLAGDESVKKMKIVIYTHSSRNSKGFSVFGDIFENNSYVYEIKDKSYFYSVEITLLASEIKDAYSSVNMLYGFAPLVLPNNDKDEPFYYDHSSERENYKEYIPNRGNEPSNTGTIPCGSTDYGKSCSK